MAEKKKIHTDIAVSKDFIVTADRNKIKQVFINLFNNALKFTPEGGRITISAEDHDTEWEFAIQDTGIGIDKKDIPRLFSRFYQAEDVMTRKQGGFGLGLAIVKGIVELHKGRIDVDSEKGKGTKIAAVFPKTSAY
jgi:two-component system phosphate regulon sensor histidine kinase PhoR